MMRLSDLVVIVTHHETIKSDEKLRTADHPKWVPEVRRYLAGKRDPDHYQGYYTDFLVLGVLKGEVPKRLRVSHFFYSRGPVEFNGGFFAYFHPVGASVIATIKGGKAKGEEVGGSSSPTYLAFLKRRDDGLFVPVGGDYDSATSFRLLVGMGDGARIYAKEHFSPDSD